MSNLFIETVCVNRDKGYRINYPEFNETKFDHMGQLYKALLKEYGRCVKKQYIDIKGKPVQIGLIGTIWGLWSVIDQIIVLVVGESLRLLVRLPVFSAQNVQRWWDKWHTRNRSLKLTRRKRVLRGI